MEKNISEKLSSGGCFRVSVWIVDSIAHCVGSLVGNWDAAFRETAVLSAC